MYIKRIFRVDMVKGRLCGEIGFCDRLVCVNKFFIVCVLW